MNNSILLFISKLSLVKFQYSIWFIFLLFCGVTNLGGQDLVPTETIFPPMTSCYEEIKSTDRVIPIVFHVLAPEGKTAENFFSEEEACLAVRALNEANGFPDDFKFYVAGYIFKNTSDLNEFRSNHVDKLMRMSRWNTNHFLNIWIINKITDPLKGGQIAGFARRSPSHGSSIDGVVVVSPNGDSNLDEISNYKKTIIHEVGHYFNLEHTFETFEWDGSVPFGFKSSTRNCVPNNINTGDFIADVTSYKKNGFKLDQIPLHLGCKDLLLNILPTVSNFKCQSSQNFPIKNFMSYVTNDDCQNEFSLEQKNRMSHFYDKYRYQLDEISGEVFIPLSPFGAIAEIIEGNQAGMPNISDLASPGIQKIREYYEYNKLFNLYWFDKRTNDNPISIEIIDINSKRLSFINAIPSSSGVNTYLLDLNNLKIDSDFVTMDVQIRFYNSGTNDLLTNPVNFVIIKSDKLFVDLPIAIGSSMLINTAKNISFTTPDPNIPLKAELSINGGRTFSIILEPSLSYLGINGKFIFTPTVEQISSDAVIRISHPDYPGYYALSESFSIEAYDFCENARDILVQSEPCTFFSTDISETEFNFYNSTESGDAPTCGTPLAGDVWGRLYVPPSGKVVIEARGSSADGQLAMAVYDACGNDQTNQLACVSTNPIKLELEEQDGIHPEQELYVRLWYINSTYHLNQKAVICAYAPDGGAGSTCEDGIQNGNEIGIDCGGNCTDCPTSGDCNNGIKDGDETGIDCGGSTCAACNIAPNLKVNNRFS